MPSTYSGLKIQLMATGENATTWGNVTNLNLGTALEEAIVGSADVTFASANVTLTWTDTNDTQTARNMRLNLIGTTGGARNLIVPATEKVYIVNNACADAITVKNSTGTGIAVPAGRTMWVYNNGTNVVDVATYMTSLTLGTPLGTASGGLGNNTGSGAALTNLNVANVSAGVLAAAYGGLGNNTSSGAALTSLNASNVASGTLAVSYGGTGANTLTAGSVVVGNGTSAVNLIAPGTSGNVLTSDGSGWVSTAPVTPPSGITKGQALAFDIVFGF